MCTEGEKSYTYICLLVTQPKALQTYIGVTDALCYINTLILS